jgi:hypothetical protein
MSDGVSCRGGRPKGLERDREIVMIKTFAVVGAIALVGTIAHSMWGECFDIVSLITGFASGMAIAMRDSDNAPKKVSEQSTD